MDFSRSLWEWESKTRSIVALILFVLGCYYFEPFMIPVTALLIMFKHCIVSTLTTNSSQSGNYQVSTGSQDQDVNSEDGPATPGDDDDDEDDKDKVS